MASVTKLAQALPKNSALFLCDMQEKFRSMITYYPQILATSSRILQAAKILEMPVIVTEQYPKGEYDELEHSDSNSYHMPSAHVDALVDYSAGSLLRVPNTLDGNDHSLIGIGTSKHMSTFAALGATCSELDVGGMKIFPKTNFNMLQKDVDEYLGSFEGVENVVICGIEAHVCVKATVYELLRRGLHPHVVVDAVSSRSMTDRMYALKAMSDAGAQMTTSESLILGFVEDSAHPKFKEIQKLIMESAPDSGLLGSQV